jgi:hypothetical protein
MSIEARKLRDAEIWKMESSSSHMLPTETETAVDRTRPPTMEEIEMAAIVEEIRARVKDEDPYDCYSSVHVRLHFALSAIVCLIFSLACLFQIIEFPFSAFTPMTYLQSHVSVPSLNETSSSSSAFDFTFSLESDNISISSDDFDTVNLFYADLIGVGINASNFQTSFISTEIVIPFNVFQNQLLNNNTLLLQSQQQKIIYESLQPVLCASRIQLINDIYNDKKMRLIITGLISSIFIIGACVMFFLMTAKIACAEIRTVLFSSSLKLSFLPGELDFLTKDLDEPIAEELPFGVLPSELSGPEEAELRLLMKEVKEEKEAIREMSKTFFSDHWFVRMSVTYFPVRHDIYKEKHRMMLRYYFFLLLTITGFSSGIAAFDILQPALSSECVVLNESPSNCNSNSSENSCQRILHRYSFFDIPHHPSAPPTLRQTELSSSSAFFLNWTKISVSFLVIPVVFGFSAILWSVLFFCTGLRACCAKTAFKHKPYTPFSVPSCCTFAAHTGYHPELFAYATEASEEEILVTVTKEEIELERQNQEQELQKYQKLKRGDADLIAELGTRLLRAAAANQHQNRNQDRSSSESLQHQQQSASIRDNVSECFELPAAIAFGGENPLGEREPSL